MWARVAGDALDLAVLAAALRGPNPRRRNVALAAGSSRLALFHHDPSHDDDNSSHDDDHWSHDEHDGRANDDHDGRDPSRLWPSR